MKMVDIIGGVCGFAITVIGVFQMQMFKDLNTDLSQFSYMLLSKSKAMTITPNHQQQSKFENLASSGGGVEVCDLSDENVPCLAESYSV